MGWLFRAFGLWSASPYFILWLGRKAAATGRGFRQITANPLSGLKKTLEAGMITGRKRLATEKA
jgi:hypothetical protein